jgi:hypothetical protein
MPLPTRPSSTPCTSTNSAESVCDPTSCCIRVVDRDLVSRYAEHPDPSDEQPALRADGRAPIMSARCSQPSLALVATNRCRTRFGDTPAFVSGPSELRMAVTTAGAACARPSFRQRPSLEEQLRTECPAKGVQLAAKCRAGKVLGRRSLVMVERAAPRPQPPSFQRRYRAIVRLGGRRPQGGSSVKNPTRQIMLLRGA